MASILVWMRLYSAWRRVKKADRWQEANWLQCWMS